MASGNKSVRRVMDAYRSSGSTDAVDLLDERSIGWRAFARGRGVPEEDLGGVHAATMRYSDQVRDINRPGKMRLEVVLEHGRGRIRLYPDAQPIYESEGHNLAGAHSPGQLMGVQGREATLDCIGQKEPRRLLSIAARLLVCL